MDEFTSYQSFAGVYDEFMDQTPYEEWGRNIRSFLTEYQVQDGAEILDLGCGTGKMTKVLRDYGYRMTGLDISREMLETAAVSDGEGITYICQDMREMALLHPADAVISTCDSLNYILEPEDLIQVFCRVRENLKKGGVFLFDMNSHFKYETLLAENTFAEDREDCSFIWQNFYDPQDRINEYDLTLFIRSDSGLYRKFEEVHFQRAYKTEEIVSALHSAGFSVQEVVDADSLKEPDAESERLYFISTINSEVDK
ncbi:class I SAM-dependent DNA methyltransferase [Anaerostipes sp.]|uniref:class I SAM-dependent DNA methyltransferase n=1 Tax=Anaerostipes sp. TaxID=1872530 RepID=UPI0025BD2587|nr:class I SAM-dependent methyltransferase [Anaerostipes sp.]MBS7008527.1 class I SAM-dependent methyltransferase [Anaerostipes sp.]